MKFTEDDIKRLEFWERSNPEGDTFEITREDLKSLLAYLRASEKIAANCVCCSDIDKMIWKMTSGRR